MPIARATNRITRLKNEIVRGLIGSSSGSSSSGSKEKRLDADANLSGGSPTSRINQPSRARSRKIRRGLPLECRAAYKTRRSLQAHTPNKHREPSVGPQKKAGRQQLCHSLADCW